MAHLAEACSARPCKLNLLQTARQSLQQLTCAVQVQKALQGAAAAMDAGKLLESSNAEAALIMGVLVLSSACLLSGQPTYIAHACIDQASSPHVIGSASRLSCLYLPR